MKNPYLMTMDSYTDIYSNEYTEYVNYIPVKNPYLCHGWLKDAASKAKQKLYNNKYYQKNKELWKTKYYKYEKKGRRAAEDVKSTLSNLSKTKNKYTSNARVGAKSSGSSKTVSGPAHDFTTTTKSSPHTLNPVSEYFYDARTFRNQSGLVQEIVKGTAGLAGGIATMSVGVLTANPFAVAGGAALTVLGVTNTVSAGKRVVEAVKAEKKGKAIEERKKTEPIDPKSGFHINNKSMTEEENLANVNPKYKNLDVGTKNNCVLCSVTYEMRLRGYDVTANAADQGYNMRDLERWFPDMEPQKIPVSPNQSDDFREACLAQGEGASGVVMVTWKNGGGHAMHYRVKNGFVIISDGQTNKVYGGLGTIASHVSEISYCRLDNLEPNYSALKEVCT